MTKKRRKNVAMPQIDYKKAYDIVAKSWIIHSLKMYKKSDEVIKFIDNTVRNWRVELTAGGKSLTEMKIQRGIFQRDALSPFLFVIAIMPIKHIRRKCIGGYKLQKSPEKNLPPNVHEWHQTVYPKWKRIEKPNAGSEDEQRRYRDDMWQRKICHSNNEKWKTANNGRNRINKSRKIRMLGEKETLKLFGILEVDTVKQVEMKEKIIKEYRIGKGKVLETK